MYINGKIITLFSVNKINKKFYHFENSACIMINSNYIFLIDTDFGTISYRQKFK